MIINLIQLLNFEFANHAQYDRTTFLASWKTGYTIRTLQFISIVTFKLNPEEKKTVHHEFSHHMQTYFVLRIDEVVDITRPEV